MGRLSFKHRAIFKHRVRLKKTSKMKTNCNNFIAKTLPGKALQHMHGFPFKAQELQENKTRITPKKLTDLNVNPRQESHTASNKNNIGRAAICYNFHPQNRQQKAPWKQNNAYQGGHTKTTSPALYKQSGTAFFMLAGTYLILDLAVACSEDTVLQLLTL